MNRQKRIPLLAAAALLAVGLVPRVHADPPPAPWTVREISTPQTPSVVDVDARGIWFLRAENGEIGTAQPLDNCLFISQPISGDGSILAFLLGQEGSPVGRFGMMFREGFGNTARNVTFTVQPTGFSLSYRPGPGRITTYEGGDKRFGARRLPVWLRLQREGDRFTPFTSADGMGWEQVHSPITVPGFVKDALGGVAASSGFGQGPILVAFDNPTVASSGLSPIVQACAGNGTVLLSWPPVAGAAGYLVRRSLPETHGVGADLVTPAAIKETTFSQSGLANGRALRYLVSPVFEREGRRVEGFATAITATPVATPANLSGCDINLEVTPQRGSLVYDDATGLYTVSGSGGDIGDAEDRCFLASRLVQGDFQVTVRVVDRPTRTHALAKAGLMVRESLDGPSRMAALLATVERGILLQSRGQAGEGASSATVVAEKDVKAPLLLRLVRKGNTITPFVSTDGTTFTPAGDPKTFDPPLPESLHVGYAITSHNAAAITMGTFRDLVIGAAP